MEKILQTCSNCKSWKECPGFESFTIRDIHYCPDQIRWILAHLISMENGKWPMEYSTHLPAEPSNRQPPGPAPFERIKDITGEVSRRVERCGNDGKLTFQVLSAGWDIPTLSEISGIEERKYERRVRRVVSYCSGEKARRVSYFEFCNKRKSDIVNREGKQL
jgi:hypothetical protein